MSISARRFHAALAGLVAQLRLRTALNMPLPSDFTDDDSGRDYAIFCLYRSATGDYSLLAMLVTGSARALQRGRRYLTFTFISPKRPGAHAEPTRRAAADAAGLRCRRARPRGQTRRASGRRYSVAFYCR